MNLRRGEFHAFNGRDAIGRGWLYFIRENPGVCAFLRGESKH